MHGASLLRLCQFQFHKGTIRTYLFLSFEQINYHFNSIKVQLELLALASRSLANEFQFHKGTIRTYCCCYSVPCNTAFQFHKGTIRTYFLLFIIHDNRNFNSIKVQLELGNLDMDACSMGQFQFHKGTIRTAKEINIYLNKKYFNSIKVQLELAQLIRYAWCILFQFHKGTIRTHVAFLRPIAEYSFQFHKGTIRTRHQLKRHVLQLISIP